MQKKYRNLFWLLALGAAFIFDQFFWQKPIGINIFLFFLIALLGGLIPIWLEKEPIPLTSYLLLIPAIGFALMTFFRKEPLTNVMNILLSLGALILFSITLFNGNWIKFTIQEHLINKLKFILNCFTGGILFFTNFKRESVDAKTVKVPGEKTNNKSDTHASDIKKKSQKVLPYVRGILLAAPILIILTVLLTSADPIFKQRIQDLFTWFNPDNMGEYIFRFIYILMLAYLLLSAYYFGWVESKKIKKREPSKSMTCCFLGQIEAWIILGAVNLLFLSFVILQFTYLFGGEKNIHVEGFTYSQYAVRGYFELVAVAIIVLIIFYILAMITKRQTKAQRWTFSCLGILLIGLTGVILFSAFTRLSLYEAAYGYTRLRTMTHISMIWIGLLLLAVIVLEVGQKMDRLAMVLICFIFGFGITVNTVNIDAFIVQQNMRRVMKASEAEAVKQLDTRYLYSLSHDAIPPLVAYFTDPAVPSDIRDDIGGLLACRLIALDPPEDQPWVSAHFSHTRAFNQLKAQEDPLMDYLIFDEQEWYVEVNNAQIPCANYGADESYLD
jgi:hypothetical protein